MTACAVGAYAFAEYVLGHTGPLFAATSSLIALGFSRDPRLRRVMEVGLGCTLGIVVGDLLLHWLGSGIWQAAVVLLFSILLARFLDSGTIFTTQLGLQSLLVVLLPAPAGGPVHPQHRRRGGRVVRPAGDRPRSRRTRAANPATTSRSSCTSSPRCCANAPPP